MDFLSTLKDELIPDARRLVPDLPWTSESAVLLGAICLQESGGRNVVQAHGPAQGYPQFEAGGIGAVLSNSATARRARRAIERSGILGESEMSGEISGGPDGGYPAESLGRVVSVVRTKFLNFPALQISLARLMLWANPNPLPALGDCNGAWKYYDSTWRPGKPRPTDWPANYAASLHVLSGGTS